MSNFQTEISFLLGQLTNYHKCHSWFMGNLSYEDRLVNPKYNQRIASADQAAGRINDLREKMEVATAYKNPTISTKIG